MLELSSHIAEPWKYKQHVNGKVWKSTDRIEDAKCTHVALTPLIVDEDTKNIYWGKGRLFKKIVLGNLDILLRKNETWSVSFTLHKKINSEWIKGLNVRYETLKLLDENTLRYRYEQRISEKHPSRSGYKAKTRYMWLHEIAKLLHSRGSSRVKSQPREQEDTFQKS